MKNVFALIDRFSPVSGGWTAVGLSFLIAWFDYATGYELSFALFYLLPIAMAGWTVSRLGAVLIALLCDILTVISFLAAGGHTSVAILYWNAASRLILFSTFGLLVHSVRRLLLRERGLARTDPLTGLVNRRGLEDEWALLTEHLRRHPSPVCLAIVDLDRFKLLNDRQGHAEGDLALKEWAQLALGQLRADDTVARVGGDEFVIVLPRAEPGQALARLEALKTLVDELFARNDWPVGMSVGVAVHRSGTPRWSDLMSRADRQLYTAKENGKGRIRSEL